MNIVKFSGTHAADIPTQLRELADRVEARAFGDVHNVAYVLDRGDKDTSVVLIFAAT
jgi:hypothetical protein